jgi:hypothetical protein
VEALYLRISFAIKMKTYKASILMFKDKKDYIKEKEPRRSML